MRRIIMVSPSENFRESLSAPTLISRNFRWAFVAVDPMNVRTKFEVRSFTPRDNRGYFKNLGSPYAHAPFLQNFEWAFVRMEPANVPAKFEVIIFARS